MQTLRNFLVVCFVVGIGFGASLGRRVIGDEPKSNASTVRLPEAAKHEVDFVKEIQPLLRQRCFSCHGAEQQEGGLRLDVKARAMEGGDTGKAIVVGKSADSLLVQMVAGMDKDRGTMPPDGKGTPLSASEIGVFRAWIDQGAKWPDVAVAERVESKHWSLRPISRPAPPAVTDKTRIANAIDQFIGARLEKEKQTPSREADKITLARRLHLDLLGLPPTPEQIDQYVADEQPGAYERFLDRIFSSPHYGERWGRHWLDLARYADSDGYEKDRPRPFAWRYRHWVLDAVNSDMPFDQFTREQLAGDLLTNPSLAQKTAVGFHRNTLHNTEGGTDQEEDRVKKTVDRTNTLGTVWLGMTVACAQCHTHKYDPITQREYYSLYAFFNSIAEVDIDAPTQEEQQRLAEDTAAHQVMEAKLKTELKRYQDEKFDAALRAWEEKRETRTTWLPLDVVDVASQHGAKFAKQKDGSWLAAGENKLADVYTVTAMSPLKRVTAMRLEVLPDDSLPGKGPGRSKNGNFVLASLKLSATPISGGTSSEIPFVRAQANFSQDKFGVALAINGSNDDGWAISPKFGQRHVAVFELEKPLESSDGFKLSVTLDQNYKGPEVHNLGRFAISVTDASAPVSQDGPPAEVAKVLETPPAKRTAKQKQQLSAYFQTIDSEFVRLASALADHQTKAPKLPADKKSQSVQELAKPRDTRIQIRGDFLSPGDPVNPTTFAVLPPLKSRASRPDRVDLANWLFDPAHPLTARVAVNRLWQHCFGRGIVPTVDDFGKQGDVPSHPELLDWLASEFRDNGWSIKHLHRLIVTSATYRQSSATRNDLMAVDPENSLFARQTRRRVEAEIVRDLALSASGQLDRRIGGPSVRPPQPGDYSNLTYANSAKWTTSAGGDAYRRGMYTFFQRTSPYPMLATFDAPDSNECCARRTHSNTPLQSLTLWNDPVFFELAQAFARRIVCDVSGSEPSEDLARRRAEHAFRICMARRPTAAELKEVVALFDEQLRDNRRGEVDIVALNGKSAISTGVAPDELAAWVIVGRALLNLDEFITRE